jgi:hypothetical protein
MKSVVQSAVIACAFLAAVACGHDSKPKGEPSFRDDFREKFDFAQAAFDVSLGKVNKSSSNLSTNEYDFLDQQLRNLESIEPISAYGNPKTLDNVMAFPPKWKFETNYSFVRIDSVRAWAIGDKNYAIFGMDVYLDGVTAASLGANPGHSYRVNSDNTFDYETNAPQYVGRFATLIRSQTELLKFSDVRPAGANWFSMRHQVIYSVMGQANLDHLNAWRSRLSDIRAELRDLRYRTESNYPYEFRLRQLSERLKAAYSALP